MDHLGNTLRTSPTEVGMAGGIWDGTTLSAYIKKKYEIDLGVRQSQRLFRLLGFRLRKPRPLIAHADPEEQRKFKKNLGG
jgi:transposase